MDWLTFVATMTGHLMWPLVIIVLLFLLRKHIGVLADRIEEFSFGGAKFVWKKKLEEGAVIIKQELQPELIPPPQQPPPQGEPAILPETAGSSKSEKREQIAKAFAHRREMRRQLLINSAFGKVLSGLDEVDKVLFEIADRMGLDPASPSNVIYSLVAQQNLPTSIARLYTTLRDARNLIAHSPSLPDKEEADEYLRQTHYLLSILESVKQKMSAQAAREQYE